MSFYDQPGWRSATGDVEIWTGEKAATANQLNRDRLLTEARHATIGLPLAQQEDTTIVVTPTKWLSRRSDLVTPAIEELGGDTDSHPPDTWFKDLSR